MKKSTNPAGTKTVKIELALEPLLQARGWSLWRLAREIGNNMDSGISYQTLKNIQDGEHSPSLQTISKIACALNVTHSEILRTVKDG